MNRVRQFIEHITYWGISEELDVPTQRKVMLSNQILLGTIILTLGMEMIFLSQRMFMHLALIQLNMLTVIGGLLCNKFGFIRLSRVIISVLPPLLVTLVSVYTKMNGQGLNLMFLMAPRLIIVVLLAMPIILFSNDGYKYAFGAWLPGMFCLAFFEDIHLHFGIEIYKLPWGQHPNLSRIFFFNMSAMLTLIIYVLQSTNQRFEQRIERLLQDSEEKNEELAIQNEIIAQSNKNITDSINYARRIQQAILGHTSDITRHFKDAFILFQPKDIVSGDFYWFSRNEETGLKILIAADCTGHGVPGAFMTVMGNDLLNEVVNNRHITNPAHILHELDRKVLETFQKQNADRQTNDGMDISVMVIDEVQGRVYFAGAKNPLYYVRNGQINEIKGSRFPIGSAQFKTEKTFTTHEIEIQAGDVYYIFSDGFQDQFGGEKDQKYMTRRFRELLASISHLPMRQQEDRLRAELHEWKAGRHQTDDVLIIGTVIS